MEKPRKMSFQNNHIFDCNCRACVEVDAFNLCHDQMSTWLEGEVDELIEDLKRVDHHTVAEEIWRIQQLLRKLTGKV